jgi:hypothetical protein
MEVIDKNSNSKKQCLSCLCIKDVSQFYTRRKNSSAVGVRCKDCDNLRKKQWYLANKDKVIKRVKSYYKENKEQKLQYARKYRQGNMQKYYAYRKDLLKKDEVFRVSCLVRNSLYRAFKVKEFKRVGKTAKILGCSFEELVAHLKTTWKKNYNTEHTCQEVHIDHIIPLSSAKTAEEVYKLSHYTNLQYLTPEDNYKKSDNLNWRTNE